MVQPDTKQFRRSFRKRKRKVEAMTGEASKQLDKHVFNKIGDDKGTTSWRFIVSWLLLFIVLISGVGIQARALGRYYIGPQPIAGGEFVEGMDGDFSNANPLFAASSVDAAVSRLIFNGLLKYDDNGNLVGDLAESWTVDDKGTTYTVVLKSTAKWHDGSRVVSEDVVYTIQALQNPDTKSPFNLSWQGVNVTAVDENTVVFTLPNSLSSFVYSLTQGIVPAHVLRQVPNAQLRSNEFNNKSPIGTGPFIWDGVTNITSGSQELTQRIRLRANPNYYLGKPKLNRFTIETFENQSDIKAALNSGRINAAALDTLSDLSNEQRQRLGQFTVPYMSGVYLFFNTSHQPLNDKTIRTAIAKSVNTDDLRAQLEYPVISVNGPFLRSHSTYDPTRVQIPINYAEAAAQLDAAGWPKSEGGFLRQKDQQVLEFTLLSEDRPEFAKIADVLQRQMSEVGIKLNIELKSGREFQQRLLTHQYDALLYGISLGADPDVFAFWHSSQAVSERFNLSEYRSGRADASLEDGRTRRDTALRTLKYRPFLDAWREDAPAIGLYQPQMLYVTNGPLYGFNTAQLVGSSDRFSNVHEWMINTEQAPLL